MVKELVEGWDMTVSHNMGYKSYQKEKLFTSISLSGLVVSGANFRLAMAVKDLVTVYNILSNYKYLFEKGDLSDNGREQDNKNEYAVELDKNKNTLDRVEGLIDNLEESLSIEELSGNEELTDNEYANLTTFRNLEDVFNSIFDEFYSEAVNTQSTGEEELTEKDIDEAKDLFK